MELSPFLNSTDSLAERQNFTNSFGFEGDFDRDIITTSKILNGAITSVKIGTAAIGTANIGTLSFNQVSGGTANLGGTVNGNGFLSLKNAGGSEIIKLDNTGLTVTNGSLTIKDSGGTTIMDATGLVSTSNFISGFVTSTSDISIGSTSYADIPGLIGTFILTRTTNVLMGVSFVNQSTDGDGLNPVGFMGRVTVGGTQYGPLVLNYASENAANNTVSDALTQSSSFMASIGAGTHIIKAQGRRDPNASGTATVFSAAGNGGPSNLWYLVLGK